MTKEMSNLYIRLFTVDTDSLQAAYDYIGDQINQLEMDGALDVSLTKDSLKNLNKDFKLLKKIYHGKSEQDPQTFLEKYKDDTIEHFFLSCVIRILSRKPF